jgi:hypothetical protein
MSAQFLGYLRPAQTLGLGSLNVQTGAGVYEDAFTLMGRFRYGVAARLDMSVSVVLLDLEATDDLEALLGGDIEYQVSDHDLGQTLDVVLGGFIQYYAYDTPRSREISNLAVGMDVVASRPIDLSTRLRLTPYGRLNLRVNRVERDDWSDSEFNIGFNVGALIPLSNHVDLTGEAQLDDQFGFVLGVSFFMW